MRDLFVLGLLGVAILFAFRYPFVGILGWTWISFLNPHRLSFGLAFDFPIAMAMGMAVILAFIFSKEPKKPPPYPLFWIVVFLVFWIGVTTLFAHDPEWSKDKWETSTKVLLMALLAAVMLTTRERVHAMVWLVVVTLGYFGVKGGVFTIITAGSYRVWGPLGTFIQDNNQLALALITTLPLMYYLASTTPYRWMKIGLWCGICMMFFSILGSQSRGALVGIVAMAGFFVWRTRYKAPAIIASLLLLFVGASFVPDHWIERMQTIDDWETDGSAMGRIYAWTFAVKLALDNPITGGGFHVSSISDLFFSYVPEGHVAKAFHSIWFEMLGAHGFVGLAIFITMLYLSWSNCSLVRRKTREIPQLHWAYDLASMLQVSLIGYMATGTFVNLAFFDLIYTLIAVIIGMRVVVERELKASKAAEQRSRRPLRGRGPGPLPKPGISGAGASRRQRSV